MGLYLTTARLTPESFKAMATGAQDRREVLGDMMSKVGGKLLGYYFAFGDSDVVVISEAPDNVSIASMLMAVAGSGSVSDVNTTVLMSYEEGIEAIKRSAGVAYTPPGG